MVELKESANRNHISRELSIIEGLNCNALDDDEVHKSLADDVGDFAFEEKEACNGLASKKTNSVYTTTHE